MKNKKTNTVKIALWYTISNLLTNALAFISTPLFSRILTKSDYGKYSNFSSWLGIIQVIITLNVGATISRAKYDYLEDMDKYISSLVIFNNMITLGACIIIEIFSDYFEIMFSMDIIYIRIMLLYLFFSPASSYLQLKHRMFGKYKFFVFFSITSALIRTLSSVIFVILMTDKFFARVAGDIITILIFNFFLWGFVLYKGRSFCIKHVLYALVISLPLVPHKLAGNLLTHSDKIMITNMCGAEQNAIYALTYTISNAVSILWTAMNLAWTPWLYDRLFEKNIISIRENSKRYLCVFSLLVIIILLLAPEAILILGGSKYYEARFLMPPIMLAGVMQFVYGMYVNIEIFTKKTYQISLGTVIAGILNIVLNKVFIPLYGYSAAAYTTLIGYTILLIFHYILVHIYNKEYSNIYDTRFFVKIIFSMLVIGGCSVWLYKHDLIRWSIVGIYVVTLGIIGFHNKKQIMDMLR